MVVRRGEVWWAALPEPVGSGPGYRRPVVVVQDNDFNDSPIGTEIIAAMTKNLALSAAPGNVLCPRQVSGLPRDSVVNVSALLYFGACALLLGPDFTPRERAASTSG